MLRLTSGLCALGILALSGTASFAGCVQAGGEATMVTEDLAKFMANAALKNSMKAHGWTPHGEPKLNCDTNLGLPHCVAKQKACG